MRTLNLNEAAAFLRLHPHTLEAKARAGEVPAAKPGKCWVFIDVDLADWLRAQYQCRRESRQSMSEGAAASTASGPSAAKALQKILERPKRKRNGPKTND